MHLGPTGAQSSLVGGAVDGEPHVPFHGDEPDVPLDQLAAAILEVFPKDAYPHFVEFTVDHALQPGYDFGASFEFGLDLILDGLERAME